MRPASPGPVDQPARSDSLVKGLSEAIGGPLGEHGVRDSTGLPPRSFWQPTRVILVLICLTLSLHWVQKGPCRDGAWSDLSQYKYMCYTDVLALYYAEGLSEGKVPYQDHPVEYPVLTGALMGVLGLPVHAIGDANPEINQAQLFYDLNALVLAGFGIAAVAAILAVRRRRPWDAAMFALAPALLVTATVNWDLLAVGLFAVAMLAWARSRPALAGVLLGLAVAAKFYPILILGPLFLLAYRTNKWKPVGVTTGLAVLTWLVVNVPVALMWPDSWLRFFRFNTERGIDWGTLWYIGAHLPTGGGGSGLPGFAALNSDSGHAQLNILYLALFILACFGIASLVLIAPRTPRLAQLTFLVVAAFLLTGKVWSQQYVLWLIPLAVLARPRWGAFLAWQFAELCYFAAFYGELMGASGRQVFPEWVFVLAAGLRMGTLCLLVGYVVREILRPERDVVRASYDGGDPDCPQDFRAGLPTAALADPSYPQGGAEFPQAATLSTGR